MSNVIRRSWMACLLALAAAHAGAETQDRSQFETATAKMCVRDLKAKPSTAQATEVQLASYCACYAAEMAKTVPDDIFNTSRSAATPEQSKALKQLADAAGNTCSGHLR